MGAYDDTRRYRTRHLGMGRCRECALPIYRWRRCRRHYELHRVRTRRWRERRRLERAATKKEAGA